MLSGYQNKHVFLSEYSSTHTFNLISNIIYKNILNIDDVIVVLYRSTPIKVDNKRLLEKSGINVLTWEEAKNLNISFKTLNPLSLTSRNADIICYFLDENYIDSSAVTILMQDDEIDRWWKLFSKNKKLNTSEVALIDNNVLRVLQEVDNYIVPYNTWGSKLEIILGRELNIIDVIAPFNLIDYNSQDILENFLSVRKSNRISGLYKILVHTKPSNKTVLFKSLKTLGLYLFKKSPAGTRIKVSLWGSMDPVVVSTCRVLNKLLDSRNIPIDIGFVSPCPHSQYFTMISDYDCLILQERGGFSTAKYFAEKIGKVITITDSLNDLTFKLDYGINTFNSLTLEEALNMAISSINLDESEELHNFSTSIEKKHNISFKSLKEYWRKFD